MKEAEVINAVRRALGSEPRVDLPRRTVRIYLDRGDLVLEGEVVDIGAKKLALERAAAIPGVDRIIDRLHVATPHHVPDEVQIGRICDLLESEPSLRMFRLIPRRLALNEEPTLSQGERGYISVAVEDGVVTLDGSVTSLTHKRIAGALAWWAVGVRDVVNGLGVEPPEEDNDGEITDATRVMLEKDGTVHDENVQVTTRDAVVRLTGVVGSEEEARHAELDAWSIFGVDRVENELLIEVAPNPPRRRR